MHQPESPQKRFTGDYLFCETPAQLLVVGQLQQSLLDSPVKGVEVRRLSSLNEARQYALHPDRKELEDGPLVLILQIDPDDSLMHQSLGQAVQAFPHRVLVHCTDTVHGSVCQDDALFAFGFRKLQTDSDSQTGEKPTRWFEYRLSQYKSTPDWLNARYWANPERFDNEVDLDVYDDEEDDDEEE